MKFSLLTLVFSIVALIPKYGFTQKHFTDFKSINYQKVLIKKPQNNGDSLLVANADFKKINGLKNYQISIKRNNDPDKTNILILKGNTILKNILVESPYWTINDTIKIADIDGNGLIDVKLSFYNNGNGLAASLSRKVYLFNQQNTFKSIQFFDFAEDNEFDFNNDDNYEILSCNHIYKNNHSYWVYNIYNFSNNKLINVSKQFNYPLLTKHLYRTNKIIAKEFNFGERLKELRPLPNDYGIK